MDRPDPPGCRAPKGEVVLMGLLMHEDSLNEQKKWWNMIHLQIPTYYH